MLLPLTTSLSSLLPLSRCFGFYGRHWYLSCFFFDTFYCVVAWEAIINVAVVDSKRTLDFHLLKVRVAFYCILSLPKVLLDCCNKYFIVFCHVTLRKLLSYNSYFIEFHFLLNSRMHVYFYYMRNAEVK